MGAASLRRRAEIWFSSQVMMMSVKTASSFMDLHMRETKSFSRIPCRLHRPLFQVFERVRHL